jgi:hypothetical protein
LGGGGIKDTFVAEGEDGVVDCGGVEVGEGVFVLGGGKGSIVGEVGGDKMEKFGLEGVFHGAGAGVEGD